MEDDSFSRLSRFGLSTYEIKLYKSLLLYGPNTPTAVVKISGVPQPRVYDLFNSLERKGFVDEITGKKHLYRAVPLDDILRKEILWMNSYVADLNNYIEKNMETISVNEPYIWFVKGTNNVLDRLKSIIYSAKTEIIIALSYNSFKAVSGLLLKQARHGITVALVLFSDTPDESIKNMKDDIILKTLHGRPTELAIADRSQALSNLKSGIENLDYAIYLEEDQLLHVLSYHFYYELWPTTDFTISPGNSIYQSFSTIWLACEVINYYLSQEIEIGGELEGYYNNSKINISGKILDVEIKRGSNQTFYILDGNKTYSVGGKSAITEDIKLINLRIRRIIKDTK